MRVVGIGGVNDLPGARATGGLDDVDVDEMGALGNNIGRERSCGNGGSGWNEADVAGVNVEAVVGADDGSGGGDGVGEEDSSAGDSGPKGDSSDEGVDGGDDEVDGATTEVEDRDGCVANDCGGGDGGESGERGEASLMATAANNTSKDI